MLFKTHGKNNQNHDDSKVWAMQLDIYFIYILEALFASSGKVFRPKT